MLPPPGTRRQVENELEVMEQNNEEVLTGPRFTSQSEGCIQTEWTYRIWTSMHMTCAQTLAVVEEQHKQQKMLPIDSGFE